jgi:hypothetical protein
MRSQDLELIPSDILLQLAEEKKRRTKDALLSYIAQRRPAFGNGGDA